MIPKSIAAIRPSGSANRLPWWRSAWKKPSTTAWRRKARTRIAASASQSWPAATKRVAVVELDPVEPFQRQHPPRGAPPVDVGNVIAGLGDHIFLKLAGRGRLALEVELARGPLLEMGDDQARAEPLGFAAIGFDMRRGPFVGFDRLGEFLLDARAQHLDRDIAAFGRDRAVDLGDRGGADRHFVELGIEAFERRSERAFRSSARIERERGGGKLVLQLRQVRLRPHRRRGRGGSTGVWPSLIAGRPDFLQRRGIIGRRRAARAPKRAMRASRRTWGGVAGSCSMPVQRAMPRQRPAPFEQPPQMGRRARGQIFQPLWIVTSPPSIGSARARTKPASAIIRAKASGRGKRRMLSTR